MFRRISLLLVAGLVIGSAPVFYQLRSAAASQSQASSAEVTDPLSSANVPTPFPQAVSTVAPTPSRNAIAEEIQALNSKWAAEFLQGGGWLHLVIQHDRNKDKVGTLPNGQPIPMDYVEETWWQLNEKNLVVAAVTFMRDETGQVVQIAIFRDGLWHNLTFSDQPPTPGEAFAPDLDFGFSNDVVRSEAWGSRVSRGETLNAAGQKTVTFTIHDDFAKPKAMAGYEKDIVRGESRATFDAQSGQLLYVERVMVMADGETRTVERAEFVTVEHVNAPSQEAAEYLNQEVTK
jgi:hypothetical protein